jgi:hypothetical protein
MQVHNVFRYHLVLFSPTRLFPNIAHWAVSSTEHRTRSHFGSHYLGSAGEWVCLFCLVHMKMFVCPCTLDFTHSSLSAITSQYDSSACNNCGPFPQIFLCRKIDRGVLQLTELCLFFISIGHKGGELSLMCEITPIENSVGSVIICYITFHALNFSRFLPYSFPLLYVMEWLHWGRY